MTYYVQRLGKYSTKKENVFLSLNEALYLFIITTQLHTPIPTSGITITFSPQLILDFTYKL